MNVKSRKSERSTLMLNKMCISRNVIVSVIASIVLTGLSAHGKVAPVFQDVIVHNRFFDGSVTRPSVVVKTRVPVRLDVIIYDYCNQLVAVVLGDDDAEGWEIKVPSLPVSTRGLYTFALVASDQEGRLLGRYPAKEGRGGQEVMLKMLKANPSKKSVIYELSRPSLVKLECGLKESLYIDGICQWVARPSGVHEEIWSGSESEGPWKNIMNNPNCNLASKCVALPVNALVDTSGDNRQMAEKVFSPAILPERLSEYKEPWWPDISKSAKMRSNVCLDSDMALVIREMSVEEGKLRFSVEPESADERRMLMKCSFEMMVFIDGIFIIEDEEAILPSSWDLLLGDLSHGSHTLTVNVVNRDRVPGAVSQEFVVGMEGDKK